MQAELVPSTHSHNRARASSTALGCCEKQRTFQACTQNNNIPIYRIDNVAFSVRRHKHLKLHLRMYASEWQNSQGDIDIVAAYGRAIPKGTEASFGRWRSSAAVRRLGRRRCGSGNIG